MNDHQNSLQRPAMQYRPEVRWWLAEGFHTDETLKKEVNSLYETGFGAAEFLAMEEPGADSRLYGWGSEEWVHDTHTLVEETTKHGMGVSMTSGTNWSNANLTCICPDDRAASKELDYEVRRLRAGERFADALPQPTLKMPGVTKQELVAVVAAGIAGEKEGKLFLDRESCTVLTERARDGRLDWTAPADGEYLLFAFWMHGTGQTAAPSVSVSYTVNYLDRYGVEALKAYWDENVLTPALREQIAANGRAMMYMDSLELGTFARGGQLWGYHFLEEFQARRGYDLTPYLPFIVKNAGMMTPVFVYHYGCEEALFIEKLHNDLYQTMTDLYMENMLRPMQEWLHSHGMTLRAEISYGLPFEISQPGKYVDGIETESLEFGSQIESYRNLAGPAHVYNRLYSSETGATVMNYMCGLEFYTQIIYTQFAAGIAKTVLHGYSSIAGSEASTYWPGHEGMWPIFSERFGERQPSFCHYKEWTAMIARYQMVLRQGQPQMDLAILRFDYNFNNAIAVGGRVDEKELYEHGLMRANEGLYWQDSSLQNAGYTWDYFAPQLLEEPFMTCENGVLQPQGPSYQAVVLYQEALPVESARRLLVLAKAGLPVVFVNGVTENVRPGGITKTHRQAASMTPFLDGRDEELAQLVAVIKALPNVREIDAQPQMREALEALGVRPRAAFGESNRNILTHLRRDGEKLYVYAYNMQYTEETPFAFTMNVRTKGTPYRIDCWNGETEKVGCYRVQSDRLCFDLTLAPGEACLYAFDEAQADGLHAVAITTSDTVSCAEAPADGLRAVSAVASDVACAETSADGGHTVRDNARRADAEALQIVREADGSLTALAFRSGVWNVALSDGTVRTVRAKAPDDITLSRWKLTVEDWNEGAKRTIVEDRGLGIVTREVYFETKKTRIDAGETALLPWKDIPAVGPEVSGVGFYTTQITLPPDWDKTRGARLRLQSVNGHTAAVYINGQKAGVLDHDALCTDVSSLLTAGENTVTVEVTSSLNNRLLARGYYEKAKAFSRQLAASANNAMEEMDEENDFSALFDIKARVQDYGLTGAVLETYARLPL